MLGLGQFGGDFASPAFPDEGPLTWAQVSGMHPGDPYVAGPAIGGFGVVSNQDLGVAHVATGTTDPHMSGGRQHWSELLNFKHSPMPYLALAAILMLGLVQIQVAGRIGR